MTTGVTQRLSRFVAHVDASRVPRDVLDRAGLVIALERRAAETGRRHPTVEAVCDIALTAQAGGGSVATVVGRRERFSPAWAALVNACAASAGTEVLEQRLRSSTHAIVAATVATAEQKQRSTDHTLVAVAIGIEVQVRLMQAISSAMRPGWSADLALSYVSAAAAAARAAGVDSETAAHVLGLAGTQLAGLRQNENSPSHHLFVGKAAASAVEAVLLVERGFTAPDRILEGRRGIAAVTAPGADLHSLTAGLSDWDAVDVDSIASITDNGDEEGSWSKASSTAISTPGSQILGP